ncbi:MAG TPA: hypothetical protein VEX86_09145 [Longimicrobium sp.]|nr:hypothetical protein [Longimicrobium sp.]
MPKLTVLLLATLAACSTMPPGTASPPPAMPPAPAGFGPGVYSVTLADSDLPLSAPTGMRTGMVGTWEMTVDGPGRALVRFNGQQVVDMPFQMQGSQVTFSEGTGQYACQGPGRYTWEATAAGLRFTRVEDSCNGRAVALTSRAWTKRP